MWGQAGAVASLLLLLLVVLAAVPPRAAAAVAANAARIEIVHPPHGAVVEIPPGEGSTRLRAKFALGGVGPGSGGGVAIGRDGVFLHVEADGDQVVSDFFEPMDYIQLVKLEPGTHTVAMQLRWSVAEAGESLSPPLASTVLLAEARVIFDVVLPSVPLFFPPVGYDRFLGLAPPRPFVGPEGFEEPIRVGVIASLKLDGQKTIWLEQFRHFPRTEYNFRFICYTANQGDDGKMVAVLDELNVPARLVDGLSISLELADVPDFPLNLVRLIRANTDVRRWATDLRPAELRFMHDFFEAFVVPLFGLDLVTFANARTEIDTLIVEAARLAGVKRIVMELPNLYPPQHVRVDALVAPSHFVKHHPSVQADPTPCFVITPGIYFESFLPHTSVDAHAPLRLGGGDHSSSSSSNDNSDNWSRCGDGSLVVGGSGTCVAAAAGTGASASASASAGADDGATAPAARPFRVGFVARLAPEKNPGMFLRMAAELAGRLARRGLLREPPAGEGGAAAAADGAEGGSGASGGHAGRRRRVEFVVVGDGEIRGELEEFARWLLNERGGGGGGGSGSSHAVSGSADVSAPAAPSAAAAAASAAATVEATLRREAAALGGADPLIKFVGWVKRDELPALLSTVDVLVNPSLRDSETFCIANLEAMAAGAALVTFANGGQSEYMRNNTYGLVVGPAPTVTGLADSVEWLMDHPAERHAMAARARALVAANYTMAGNMEAYRRFYSWIMTSDDVHSILQD